MNQTWNLLGTCAVKLAPQDIGKEYRNGFNWGEGRRLPDESKIVHIACDRALGSSGLAPVRSLGNRVGIVLAGCFGGLASYERFRAGLADNGELQPLAFTYSLPGIPASVLSLYYGITGPVISVSTVIESGAAGAVSAAAGLMQSGLCDHVIIGAWYFPSDSARHCTGLVDAMASVAILSGQSGRSCDGMQNVDVLVRGDMAGMNDYLLDFLSFRQAQHAQQTSLAHIISDAPMEVG